MILEVGTDPGKVRNDIDTGLVEQPRWADATALKNLWGVHSTSAHDDFEIGTDVDLVRGAATFNPLRKCNTSDLFVIVELEIINAVPGEDMEILAT